MENPRLIYIDPHIFAIDDLIPPMPVTDVHMEWFKENLPALKKHGVNFDVYTLPDFVLAFNNERISNLGLLVLGTEEEIYHILNP